MDVVLLCRDSGDDVEVGQAVVLHVGGGEAVKALLHPIGEDARNAQYLRARFTQDVHNVQNAAAGGDEVLDDDDLLARLKAAFDLVFAAVVLAGRAHIAHGKAHHVADDGRVRDACRACAHQDLRVGVIGADELAQRAFHLCAHLGRGQDQAVVAVDGTLDAAGPGEGLVRAEKDRADGEQALCNAAFQMLHFYLFSFQMISRLTRSVFPKYRVFR